MFWIHRAIVVALVCRSPTKGRGDVIDSKMHLLQLITICANLYGSSLNQEKNLSILYRSRFKIWLGWIFWTKTFNIFGCIFSPAFRSIAEGGKRSVFLTNTQALARQQAEVIGKMTSLKVAVYTGDMPVDNWNREQWNNEFENAQVYDRFQ